MKILYITSFFNIKGSSAAVRNAGLVKGLVENGHIVDVLTLKYPENKTSHLFSKIKCNKIYYTDLPITDSIQKNRKYLHFINNSFVRSLKNFIRDFIYFPDVWKDWYKHVNPKDFSHYDIIISSSDSISSHYVGKSIKSKNLNLRWIQVWGDPWTIDVSRNVVTKLRAKRKEKKLILEADKVIYVSELTQKFMAKKYQSFSDKIFYVPRSFFQKVESLKRNEDTIDIVYMGSLNINRKIDDFLDDISIYNDKNDRKIKLYLYGEYSESILNILSKYNFVNIYSTVDYEEVLDVFSKSSLLLFIGNKVGATQIPGKLFDYLGTNLPIICITTDKNLISFLSKYKNCLIYDSDISTIVDKILYHKFDSVDEFSPTIVATKVLE